VVTFDGRAPGTDPARWEPLLAVLPALAAAPTDRTIVVAAHPDDESLGAGALLARLGTGGGRLDVVVVTDGAQSHPGSSAARPEELAARRADEVRDAVALLAPRARVRLLGFPDAGTVEHREEIARELRRVVAEHEGSLRIVAPWRGDGHRDHRVVGEVCAALAAQEGAALWEYPVWLWHWAQGPQDDAVPRDRMRALLPEDEESLLKRRAIATYRSQLHPQDDGIPVLHPRFLENFDRDVEVFVVEGPPPAAVDARYLEDLHTRHADPWGYTSRWYEERKRALTLAALPEPTVGRLLEIGSSIGVLTEDLADRAREVETIEVSATAVARARARLRGHAHVRVHESDLRDALPAGRFDVVVVSEVGYYVSRADLQELGRKIRARLSARGAVLLCHWRHPIPGASTSGDDVHRVLRRALGLPRLVHHAEGDFLMDVLSLDPRSVAVRGGLV